MTFISKPGGGAFEQVVATGSNHTANDKDVIIATAPVNVTLPAPTEGAIVAVQRQVGAGGTVTILPNSGEAINGVGEAAFRSPGAATFVADGTNWHLTTQSDGLEARTVVDTYADGDIAEYTGDTASYTVNSNEGATSNNYVQGVASPGVVRIHSESGLNHYPAQGDHFAINAENLSSDGAGGDHFGVIFAYDSANGDRYVIQCNEGDGTFSMSKKISGTSTSLVSKSLNFSLLDDVIATIDVDWQSDGTFDVWLLNENGNHIRNFAVTDTDLTGGGIGLEVNNTASATSTVNFSNFRVVG